MIRQQTNENVELNVTAMLDMAFQLLAFFVLTFRAATNEWGFRMHLPPAQAVVSRPGSVVVEPDPVVKPYFPAGLRTLQVNLFSESGGLDRITVNDTPAVSLDDLREKMTAVLHASGSPIEQVVVQASDRLHYATLMQVVGICADQEAPGTKDLVKLRLVAMGDAPSL